MFINNQYKHTVYSQALLEGDIHIYILLQKQLINYIKFVLFC